MNKKPRVKKRAVRVKVVKVIQPVKAWGYVDHGGRLIPVAWGTRADARRDMSTGNGVPPPPNKVRRIVMYAIDNTIILPLPPRTK